MRSVSSATAAPSRSSPAWVSAGGHRSVVVGGPADGRLDLAGLCGPRPQNPMLRARNSAAEAGAAAGRVGPHLHRPAHRVAGSSPAVVARRDPRRELADRGVEHGQLIGDRVGRRVARPQQRPRAPRRWRPRSRTSAGTRTRPCSSRRCLPCSPNGSRPATRRGPRSPAPCPSWPTIVATPALAPRPSPPTTRPGVDRVDRAEGAIQRRVRRHRPEQRRLRAEPFDVRARLAAAGQHQHRLHQHLAPIMQRQPHTAAPGCAPTTNSPTPDTVSERAQRVQPDMRDDLLAAAFHHHRNRAVTVHLASALQSRVVTRRQRQNPLSGGHFRGCATLSSRSHVNDRG